jgi:hypothetical protein
MKPPDSRAFRLAAHPLGTFNLALHAWDDPIETLLRLAPKTGARLLLPRLGEAVEPAHDLPIQTWWRGVDARPAASPPPVEELPKEMSRPVD